ncbi:adenylate/guanylate cyclase domain-containing protein [Limnoraphis robusta]|uniref:Adenylate cyclase n=1 Tax=Limnoraphis robusta CS-951 TaxID=1637645 RepID=A0A0F5Y9V5_9CYAN|nr:adenylate/guanylate cyclase domain-containing protein [Limnoraphis robusta]KKD35701.1 cyclase [Limnoraphis robusta CS-951]
MVVSPSALLQWLKHKAGNVSLRTFLIVPFITQVITTFGLVGYFSYYNAQQAVNDLASQLRNELTARINQQLGSYINTLHSINRLNADAIARGEIDFISGKGVNQFLQQIKIAPYVNSVYCGEEQTGHFIGVSRTSDINFFELTVSNASTDYRMRRYRLDVRADRMYFIREVNPYDPRVRPWYRAAKAEAQATWSEIYLDFTSQVPTITASLPAYSINGNSFVGVCGIDVLLSEELRQFLQKLELGHSGEAFIVERSGKLVSSTTDDPLTGVNGDRLKATKSHDILVKETAKYLQQRYGNLQKIRQPQQLDFELEGKRQFIEVLPFKDSRGLDWLIVLVVPENDFMAEINANNRTTFLLCLVALILTTILGLITARLISFPIYRLSQASQAIAQGDFHQSVQPENIKELRILAQSFNTMTQQLQESFTALAKTNEELENRVEERTSELRLEKENSEQLLLNILPKAIADQLKQGERTIASAMEEVTILFADVVGFTPLSAKVPPIQLVGLLNKLFSSFDYLAEQYQLEKIKTIGDAYMVVGGLPLPQENHAEAIADMALEMQNIMTIFQAETILGDFEECQNLKIRIGINTGSVVAGVIGIKKFIYDLWGDAVNIASRMESSGEPGRIQVTEETYQRLKDKYYFEARGEISVKGRGKMKTYWLIGKKD